MVAPEGGFNGVGNAHLQMGRAGKQTDIGLDASS